MSTERFNNQYRVESTRLQNWDYRWDGYYFITICTKDKIEYFGEIQNGKMVLSSLGIIADILWHEIKNHASLVGCVCQRTFKIGKKRVLLEIGDLTTPIDC